MGSVLEARRPGRLTMSGTTPGGLLRLTGSDPWVGGIRRSQRVEIRSQQQQPRPSIFKTHKLMMILVADF